MNDKLKAALKAVQLSTGFKPSVNCTSETVGGVVPTVPTVATPVPQPRRKKKRRYNERHRERSRQFFARIAQENSGKHPTALPNGDLVYNPTQTAKSAHIGPGEEVGFTGHWLDLPKPTYRPTPAPLVAPYVPVPPAASAAVELLEGIYTISQATRLGFPTVQHANGTGKYKESGAWYRATPEKLLD